MRVFLPKNLKKCPLRGGGFTVFFKLKPEGPPLK
jgi:hypothetical protein